MRRMLTWFCGDGETTTQAVIPSRQPCAPRSLVSTNTPLVTPRRTPVARPHPAAHRWEVPSTSTKVSSAIPFLTLPVAELLGKLLVEIIFSLHHRPGDQALDQAQLDKTKQSYNGSAVVTSLQQQTLSSFCTPQKVRSWAEVLPRPNPPSPQQSPPHPPRHLASKASTSCP